MNAVWHLIVCNVQTSKWGSLGPIWAVAQQKNVKKLDSNKNWCIMNMSIWKSVYKQSFFKKTDICLGLTSLKLYFVYFIVWIAL